MNGHKWEEIENNGLTVVTSRLKVEGGWIVKSCTKHFANDAETKSYSAWTSSTCFVTDPKQQWAL